MATLTIEQMPAITALLEQSGKKLIYIAGASASGKSYFAKLVKEQLEKTGKKILSISSDDYYGNLSSIKYLLYGTFDHPNLIDYDLLQKNLDEYITTGKTKLPKYSFVEKRRTSYEAVNGSADYVIVE
jgi:uridine kinase